LYSELFFIAETTKNTQRTSYDLFAVFGYVGGISAVFASIAGSILIPYSQLSFELEAITKLVKIKSKFGPPNFNFCEKFKFLL
jgi:hypothetical protein